MLIDDSGFPAVRLFFDKNGDTDVFSSFEAVLKRGKAFVLIAIHETSRTIEHEHSPEERKEMTLWMKRNREQLTSLVKGMIHIEPSAAKRLAGQAFLSLAERFWGFPVFAAASEAEASTMAMKLLMAGALLQRIPTSSSPDHPRESGYV